MRIQTISTPSFKGNVIDSHGHLGYFYDKNLKQENKFMPQHILDTIELNNNDTQIDHVLVSNLEGLSDGKNGGKRVSERKANEDIIKLCNEQGKGKLFPIAVCQPGLINETKDIEDILDKNKFYGLKFHPENTKQSVKDKVDIYGKYLEVAKAKKLPCVFHSADDAFSKPEYIIKLAENHPDVPVVLYHISCGANEQRKLEVVNKIADSVNNKKSNLFVDLSWVDDKTVIKGAIQKLGEDRVLFGTDTPISEMGRKDDYLKKINKIKEAIKELYPDETKSKEVTDKVLFCNSNKLFFNGELPMTLNGKILKEPETIHQKTNSTITKSKNKYLAMGIGTMAFLGAAYYLFKDKTPKNQPKKGDTFVKTQKQEIKAK